MLAALISRQIVARLPCRSPPPAPGASLLTTSLLLVPSLWLGVRPVFMCGNSASSMANPVIVPARATHTATIIFLHGLGDTGHGWASMLEEAVKSANLHHVKIICPTAPIIPVTLNMQFEMPAWFDIASLSFHEQQDEGRIRESSEMLNGLIEAEEKSGIPCNRIVIGGFSQGGAIALYTALTVERHLAGILALSTWLPLHKKFPEIFAGSKREYPVFQGHGDSDQVVNMQYGTMTSGLLKTFCTNNSFKKYAHMGHSSCPQEVEDVKEFLKKVLPSATSKN